MFNPITYSALIDLSGKNISKIRWPQNVQDPIDVGILTKAWVKAVFWRGVGNYICDTAIYYNISWEKLISTQVNRLINKIGGFRKRNNGISFISYLNMLLLRQLRWTYGCSLSNNDFFCTKCCYGGCFLSKIVLLIKQ